MKKINFRGSHLFLMILLFVNLVCFSACHKTTEIHIHDRHGLSYDIVKNYAEKNGPVTLVLLDYHHDVLPEFAAVSSVNWVGKLVEDDYVKKLIWLSGKKLLLPNRNARMAWLERKLKKVYPETAEKIRRSVQLVDWFDLQKLKLKEPFVITLDFDVFTKDPGDNVELFVDELCSWIQKQKPELVTMSLSASYQNEPAKAWAWLNRFVQNYKSKALWFLESGTFGEKEESKDDFAAHKNWQEHPEVFKNYEASFYSGAYLWQNAPDYVTATLLKKKIRAGNSQAQEIINFWKDEKLKKLKNTFDLKQLEKIASLAENATHDFFEGKYVQSPQQKIIEGKENYGVAVRFKNQFEDRGCLSLYTGLSQEDIPSAVEYCAMEALVDPRYSRIQKEEADELIINISVFADWEKMSGFDDFEPGLHSLLMEDSNSEKTLLQAAIALERNYTREEFLSRLSNKAGLGFDGWKKEGLVFYKARTITYYE